MREDFAKKNEKIQNLEKYIISSFNLKKKKKAKINLIYNANLTKYTILYELFYLFFFFH